MSLFKKPKKALQKNVRIFSSEIELMDDEEEQHHEIKQKKKKDKKENSIQKSSLLSFGDEGILFGWRSCILKFCFERKIHKFIYSADAASLILVCL
jgi:hypothetical protein